MKSAYLLLVPLLTVAVAGSAYAQFGGRQNRGFGGVQEEAKILAHYDHDKDGVLNASERRNALLDFGFDAAAINVAPRVPPEQRLSPKQVKIYGAESLYDPNVLRTIFLTFDTPTWEEELSVFKRSDVKVPATLQMDGKVYHEVGVSFRGQTSFMMAGPGQKRSLNLDIDFRNKEQKLLGNAKVTLLNSAGDPSFLRSVMYMHIAREYYPAFKTNYMRVVINGENWGVYVNQQPADEVFAFANGGSTGPVWKTPGSPRGRGGLEYWGDDPAPYQQAFELVRKGRNGSADAWKQLINLCRVLSQTPIDKLPAALAPIMDVDNALRMLAVDNALMNSDGYWTRASDYNLYIDAAGRFHFAVHDANETLREEEGFGGRRWRGDDGGGGSGGKTSEMGLDPLAGSGDTSKVLLNKLLQVPEYKQRYLGYMRDITQKWLNWEHFSTVAALYLALISDDIKRDTHKLYSGDAFQNALTVDQQSSGGPMGATGLSLKTFVDRRREYLLGALGPGPGAKKP